MRGWVGAGARRGMMRPRREMMGPRRGKMGPGSVLRESGR